MQNPFRNMTMAEVEAHNRRVAQGKKASCGSAASAKIVKHSPQQLKEIFEDVPVDTAGSLTRVPTTIQSLSQVQMKDMFKKKKSKSPDGMNQTERRYLKVLKERYPGAWIKVQCVTLLLSPTCRFTPDFAVFLPECSRPIMVDVKGGFTWEDSIIKNKWAATAYPMFRFIMAKWKNGKWTEKEFPAE